jgi:hypothetical protein
MNWEGSGPGAILCRPGAGRLPGGTVTTVRNSAYRLRFESELLEYETETPTTQQRRPVPRDLDIFLGF